MSHRWVPLRSWLTLSQDVEEDEREFKKKQDEERVKLARNRKVQEAVDRTREQNARRKLDKVRFFRLAAVLSLLTAV